MLAAAGIAYYELSMQGFPDGHRTEYEVATKTPFQIITFGAFIAAVYFIVMSIRKNSSLKRILLSALLVVVVCFAVSYSIHYYYREYLHLEDGEGG